MRERERWKREIKETENNMKKKKKKKTRTSLNKKEKFHLGQNYHNNSKH